MSYPLPGQVLACGALALPRAQSLAQVVQSGNLNFVRLVECRRDELTADEIVVVEVEVELSQHPVVDVRPTEMLAFVFSVDDELPKVLVPRGDFPSVVHVNLRLKDGPQSLCLYDLPWSEIKRQWTPRGMIEQAREWLARTARGVLHTPDQPLEPFLIGSRDTIVLPTVAITERAIPLPLRVIDSGKGRTTLVAAGALAEGLPDEGELVVAAPFLSSPRTHGVITRNPETLQELHEFFVDTGDDLLDQLRRLLLQLRKEFCRHPAFFVALTSRLVLIAILPKTRTPDVVQETTEIRAFLTEKNVWEIGIDIGIWDRGTIDFGPNLLYSPDLSKQGQSVGIKLLEAVFELSPESAARLSGLPQPDTFRVSQVGVGALGSQVLLTLAREGWGTWTLIDDDQLLPHNLARHAGDGRDVGRPKALVMADMVNSITPGQERACGIVADVFDAAHKEAAEALAEADIILDSSASVSVARHLSNGVHSSARRMSVFLNPSGSDVVLLAEDTCRSIPLDILEMQYYRALITEPALSQHLRREEEPIRYGGTCRDVSFQMSQELVSMHAAIASRAVRSVASNEEATIAIWQTDIDLFIVNRITVDPSPLIEIVGGNWTLRTDQQLLNRVMEIRDAKLPNETGGILIGSFDTDRHIVYVVDTVAAPPDSEEWPHLFIRGRSGLPQQIANIRDTTEGMLDYVGEWHSHPDGHSCEASAIDREAFAALATVLQPDALPPLMLIAGQDGTHRWYLEEIPGLA